MFAVGDVSEFLRQHERSRDFLDRRRVVSSAGTVFERPAIPPFGLDFFQSGIGRVEFPSPGHHPLGLRNRTVDG
jgi:hypothetical protein